MISLTKLRALDLSAPPAPGRPAHLSAASGIVCTQSYLYVVADDELALGVFPAQGKAPGGLVPLFAGGLPPTKAERKSRKPDLEALTLLPPFTDHPHGALLALGSGSTANRRTGIALALDGKGAIVGSSRAIDLSGLFAPLHNEFASLNIEGALVSGSEILLLQRGNRTHPRNAVIRFELAALLAALVSDAPAKIAPSAIHNIDLGECDGVPLCFTDGAALPEGGMVFTAIAEDTPNSYDDGPCVGSAIGIIDQAGKLSRLDQLDRPHKIEGVHADADGDIIRLRLVTDADDAAIPASLFSADLPR